MSRRLSTNNMAQSHESEDLESFREQWQDELGKNANQPKRRSGSGCEDCQVASDPGLSVRLANTDGESSSQMSPSLTVIEQTSTSTSDKTLAKSTSRAALIQESVPASKHYNQPQCSSGTSGINNESRARHDQDVIIDNKVQTKSPAGRKNKFQPFVIAENLLEGKTGQESVSYAVDDMDREQFIASRNKRLKLSSSQSPSTAVGANNSLLDIFLSDLNEINDIPFFDMELPRELAINIFWHLDPIDLCRCSQVSKAWKSLAEDELLWSQICRNLGYEEKATTMEKSDWKEIVKQHVLKERQLRLNWKTRTGHVEALEFVQGGILCAVSAHESSVAAGYSSGKVNVWDLATEKTVSLAPSSTALVINESADVGTVGNIVTDICVIDHFVAAAYTQGNVDLWKLVEGKSNDPDIIVAPGKSVRKLVGSDDGRYMVVAVDTQLLVHQLTPQHQPHTLGTTVQCERCITDVCLVPSRHRAQLLAVSYQDQVMLHVIGRPASDMVTLHNTICHYTTCLDSNADTIAVGISADENFLLKLFDVGTSRERNVLDGHTLPITALHVWDNHPFSLATGCRDRKVRVYDTRAPDPVIVLRGHCGAVRCVQMDDWKVVSGCSDGMVCVWDQRMAAKLWEQHNRHPVEYVHFRDQSLLAANIPVDKNPEGDPFDSMYHRRYRGSMYCYNFSVDAINQDLPSNMLSTYDVPEGYNYNISLAVPYDTV